jgi:hypothetical protein
MTNLEKFSYLALSEATEIDLEYSNDGVAWLQEFAKNELVGIELPSISSVDDFSNAIKTLAKNKKAWTSNLSTLILELHDSTSGSSSEESARRLREYADACPWNYLRRAAMAGF